MIAGICALGGPTCFVFPLASFEEMLPIKDAQVRLENFTSNHLHDVLRVLVKMKVMKMEVIHHYVMLA